MKIDDATKKLDVPWALGLAIAIVLTLSMAHVCGGRDAVSVLSGTPPDGPFFLLAPLGILYVMSWLATILIAPPLMIAGLVEWIARRVARQRA